MPKISAFEAVWERATDRKGGEDRLREMLPEVQPDAALVKQSDSHFLSVMSKCIFQAGFSWRVVEQKWPGFEQVFQKFEPETLTTWSDEDWEATVRDTRIIRNPQKINTVRSNLWFILDISMEHGSFGQFLASWPGENLVALFQFLKREGSRLGGATGQRFLRYAGKDTFILTRDVVDCLQRQGAEISAKPTSKRDLETVQQAFNSWHAETGMPLQHLSMVMAWSVGENYVTD